MTCGWAWIYGILSKRYQPGRYSEHEQRVVTFPQWYLAHFGHVLAD